MAIKIVRATLAGQEYELSYNAGTGMYEAVLTAPGKSSWYEEDHKYGIVIMAEDAAGNSVTVDRNNVKVGADLQLRVKEKQAPVIAFISPGQDDVVANALQPVVFEVADGDSGIDAATLKLYVNSVPVTNYTYEPITSGRRYTFTPTVPYADGAVALRCEIADNDGNTAEQQHSFVVDSVPPTLSVLAPSNGLVTNTAVCTVHGTVEDGTQVTVTVAVNSDDAETVQVVDGVWTLDVLLTEGENAITVTAKDTAGLTTVIKRTVTLDTVAPVINSVNIAPNPVDAGKTFIISVSISD